jgi:diphthine-ammonia ligase
MAATDSLNIVALISGGKDSFYSILHCLKNGHKVTALANLYPSSTYTAHSSDERGQNDEEIDSHMYQTVGASVIPLYAEALGLPLYRHAINGAAVNKDRSYSSKAAEQDETESLIPLLAEVKAAHPEVNAISTGAILSDYQRTRIESVALRLDLTPLAFLWQYPYLPPYTQGSLLADMAVVGQNSRIIKVASGGLDERHLWLNVGDSAGITARKLTKEMGRFGGLVGGAVLGEGGEYETLAIDGPSPIWKRRIVIEDGEREVIKDGGVWSLRMRGARTTMKLIGDDEQDWLERLRVPEMWDDESAALATFMKESTRQDDNMTGKDTQDRKYSSHHELQSTITDQGSTIYLSNLHAISQTLAPAEQMNAIKQNLTDELTKLSVESSSIAFTTILLRNMSDFAAINASYSTLFDTPNPPARVTIACGDTLPNGIDVVLSVIAHKPSSHYPRLGLHVQSRSYWAPANIGPYSQAISIGLNNRTRGTQDHNRDESPRRIVYVAGQIPLVPASMTLVSADFATQAALSIQHLWRIGRVMQVDWWVSCIAFITASDEAEAGQRSKMAVHAWEKAHTAIPTEQDEESEDVDIAERDLRRPWAYREASSTSADVLKTERRQLPRWEVLRKHSLRISPMFVAEVAELPRGASIEWASLGAADVGDCMLRVMREGHGGDVNVQDAFTVVWVTAEDDEHVAHLLGEMDLRYGAAQGLVEVYASGPISAKSIGALHVQISPCRSVWDTEGRRVFAVLRCRTLCA